MTPLAGIKVLDFSTLLPGPLATLMLAEAGAQVIKIEREAAGDEMRHRRPMLGAASASFAMLNGGKRSIAIDLKAPGAVARLTPLLAAADVLVEQFRPGVMARLGLGYDAVRALNPRIIYCSLTGYGQHGDRSQRAGHDLNYLAESGITSLVVGADGVPPLPPGPIADLVGGSYPLVINVLLALMQRERSETGCFFDIAMADNLAPLGYWALARGLGDGSWPQPNADAITGGLARYRHYRTRDGRFVAVGALEEKFWRGFCDLIGLPEDDRDDRAHPAKTIQEVATIIAGEDAAHWQRLFEARDICCSVVKTMQEAAAGLADGDLRLAAQGQAMPALPLPMADAVRLPAGTRGVPLLGEANALLGQSP